MTKESNCQLDQPSQTLTWSTLTQSTLFKKGPCRYMGVFSSGFRRRRRRRRPVDDRWRRGRYRRVVWRRRRALRWTRWSVGVCLPPRLLENRTRVRCEILAGEEGSRGGLLQQVEELEASLVGEGRRRRWSVSLTAARRRRWPVSFAAAIARFRVHTSPVAIPLTSGWSGMTGSTTVAWRSWRWRRLGLGWPCCPREVGLGMTGATRF